jgi:putative CocE/NonD family hydrolase
LTGAAIVFAVVSIALQQVWIVLARAPQTSSIHEQDVAVPMRDGVVLRADILRPSEGRFPTLVYRTPYGKRDALDEYTTFSRAVKRGYAVVVQDVRGRYSSGGEFRPYENEGKDGYDTIEWAARQVWSNGRVGTFGLSYPGAVQWLAAVESPPHLEAMVPAMTFSTPQNFFYSGGVWDLSWVQWIWQSIAADARVRQRRGAANQGSVPRWNAVKAKMLGTLPLDRVEELRQIAPYYNDWLHHPPDDPFWNFAELRNKYGRTRAAVLNLSGWNDDNYGPEGAITNYLGLVASRAGTPSRAALLLGPWVHGVDATARTRFGERDFGPAAAINYDEVVLGWMDRYVRDDNRGTPLGAVRHFVMGDNQWRSSDTWPPRGRDSIYYLSATARAPARGALTPTPPSASRALSTFVSNPDDPVTNPYESAGVHDYQALAKRRDVLTFDSAALARDMEVTGPIRARVYVSCDCRDTDLWVRLLDVAPDGAAHNLMSPGLDVVRASYRDPEQGRQLLTPGRVYEIRLDRLVTSNVFRVGHRARIQISATFFPNFSRNLHNGDLETVSARRQTATIRVHHDPEHPSQVSLHVVDR